MRAPLKPLEHHNIMVSRRLRGAFNQSPTMPGNALIFWRQEAINLAENWCRVHPDPNHDLFVCFELFSINLKLDFNQSKNCDYNPVLVLLKQSSLLNLYRIHRSLSNFHIGAINLCVITINLSAEAVLCTYTASCHNNEPLRAFCSLFP